MQADLLLRAHKLGYTQGKRLILDDISFELRRAQITTIIGPNGAGKSTLTNIVNGLIDNFNGEVERMPGLRIGYLPQKVYVNRLMPLSVDRLLQLTQPASEEEIVYALMQTEVGYLRQRQVHSLSEGELKRVLLARTTLGKPDLLVLDEPTAGVDVSGEIRMYELIGELRDQLQCAVLLVSHDLHLVMSQTDQVLCLNRHLCCSGLPDSVSQHPEYLALFGQQTADSIAIYAHHHDHEHDVSGDHAEHRHD
ncbi:MAG: ATP-binding cassette domain-containing protein [Gammaproteobacteria bacterium]|nr:ATP-binding cassette domain-containing protein [Gammaproteobacteria bacterium]MCP4982476.1 ATP-binding cassette domain-containing protein [Gammaproteobacteria bacterium]